MASREKKGRMDDDDDANVRAGNAESEEPSLVLSEIHESVGEVLWKLKDFQTMHDIHADSNKGPIIEIEATEGVPLLKFNCRMVLIQRNVAISCDILGLGNPIQRRIHGKFEVEIFKADGVVWKRKNTPNFDWRRKPIHTVRVCRLQEMLDENIFDHNGSLSLKVKVTTYESRARPYPSPSHVLCKVSNSVRDCLPSDMKALECDETAKDVEFKTNDGVIMKAHKLLLTARSPVFKAMFETYMQEGVSGVVNLEDVSSKCLSVLLHYIYTGRLHEDWKDVAEEVINGAEKYGLEGLLEYCDKMLVTICTNDNADHLSKLAKLFSLKDAESDIDNLVNSKWP